MNHFTEEQFHRLKEDGEQMYKSIGEVRCPVFGETVIFNAKGLEHLKFKKKNHARSQEDQYIRFKLLYLAPQILKITRTVQGLSRRKVFEFNRSNHRNEYILVDVIFYEFIAVLDEVRVKVIVRQTGTAPKYFWSIIPYWKTDIQTGTRKLHTGNLEEE